MVFITAKSPSTLLAWCISLLVAIALLQTVEAANGSASNVAPRRSAPAAGRPSGATTPRRIKKKAAKDPADGFTMMIATYQRDKLIRPLLEHLTTSPPASLRHIVVIWQNVGESIPSFISDFELGELSLRTGIPITVRTSEVNSMNERFRPILNWDQDIKTEAVMIMDDDVILRTQDMEWGFTQFRMVNPLGSSAQHGRIVGWTGRDFARNADDTAWTYTVQPQRTYSMVLSNAAFFRTEWLEMYWNESEEMTSLRAHVDEVFNCDDLLINFVVSNYTGLPPMLLQPRTPLRTTGDSGLWNRGLNTHPSTTDDSSSSPSDNVPEVKLTHFEQRPLCLERYFNHFALPGQTNKTSGYPLIQHSTSIGQDVVDRGRWLFPSEPWDEEKWTWADSEMAIAEEAEDDAFEKEFLAHDQVVDDMTPEELEAYIRELEKIAEEEALEIEADDVPLTFDEVHGGANRVHEEL